MPTVTAQIKNVRRYKDNVQFQAVSGNNIIVREVEASQFSTWEELAAWLINQEFDFALEPDWEKTLTITFHIETVVDPETGLSSQIRVVDSVIAA